ncbi:MAG: hypothetical protein [Olavius algarvensis Gamma 3 endosymbiont]|nr:MAG: hypothetical protein [Olavius algarvensis Gamma 3 endosymbiont]
MQVLVETRYARMSGDDPMTGVIPAPEPGSRESGAFQDPDTSDRRVCGADRLM